jgi:hypothetical protein
MKVIYLKSHKIKKINSRLFFWCGRFLRIFFAFMVFVLLLFLPQTMVEAIRIQLSSLQGVLEKIFGKLIGVNIENSLIKMQENIAAFAWKIVFVIIIFAIGRFIYKSITEECPECLKRSLFHRKLDFLVKDRELYFQYQEVYRTVYSEDSRGNLQSHGVHSHTNAVPRYKTTADVTMKCCACGYVWVYEEIRV